MVAQSLHTSPTGCRNTDQQKVVRAARVPAEPKKKGKGKAMKRQPAKTKPVKTKHVKTKPVKTKAADVTPVKTTHVATTPVRTRLWSKKEPATTTPVKLETPGETKHVKAELVKLEKPVEAAKPTQLTSKMENVWIDFTSNKRTFYTISELAEDPYYKDGDEHLDGKPHSRKSRSYKRAYKFKVEEITAERGGVALTADDIVAAKQFACEKADLAAFCVEDLQ